MRLHGWHRIVLVRRIHIEYVADEEGHASRTREPVVHENERHPLAIEEAGVANLAQARLDFAEPLPEQIGLAVRKLASDKPRAFAGVVAWMSEDSR